MTDKAGATQAVDGWNSGPFHYAGMGQRTLYCQGCTVDVWNCGGDDHKTRCQPQHRELNQSTLTCSRAQHMRLSRKEGKFNKDGRSQRGVLTRFLHSAKKSSLQSGSDQSGTKSLRYTP